MAEKVLVAMSGGVDSSVAAYLLQQQGYACIGVTMRLYENETAGIPRGHTCCSLDDVEDARAVAYDLGMPYYVLNFTEEFDEKVIRKFVQVYQNGGTPNPCIDCNRYLKFDHLLNRARELGCDYIATGHYVQRWQDENGRWGLRKNDDPGKDQSYVLYSLTQDQLAHTLFPLGGMHKDAVRAIAEEQGLCNARKHDSQDICFVPDGDYAAFLERYTGQPMQPGNFVDEQGHVIGRHKGAARYTIGQRKGLGISAETRLFVSGKNMAENTVTVGLESALFHSSLLADEWNWIAAPPAVGQPLPCTARTRYHQPERPATATLLPDGRVRVDFAAPQRAIAPGQAVVLYNGESVIGGGTILNVEYSLNIQKTAGALFLAGRPRQFILLFYFFRNFSSGTVTRVATMPQPTASINACTPTKAQTNRNGLVVPKVAQRDCTYSVLKKNTHSESMNQKVFSSGVATAPTAQHSLVFLGSSFLMPMYTQPAQSPTRTRATKQVIKVPTGLACSMAALITLGVRRAETKLVVPKTPPRMAPATGPSVMAPMATGMVSSDMDSGPTCR